MWFDSLSGILRVVLVGLVSYVALVAILRFSGKRVLSQLNAFDFVVTVALGSTLATILLSSDVAFLEGATALALLVLLQVVVAWVGTHLPAFRRLTTSKPTIVLRDGAVDEERLRAVRLSTSDLHQAVRQSGHGDLGDIALVVLESNGRLSVIPSSARGDGSALEDLS